MNIVPVNIKTKINRLKTDLKEYYNPNNVFPDEKLEKRVRIFEGTLAALACAAVAGVLIKKSGAFDLPKISFETFMKHGRFENNTAYYKNKLFSGKILKCADDNTATSMSYLGGKLKSAYKFDTVTSATICKKKYVYYPNGRLHRVHFRDSKSFNTTLYEEGGKITHKINNKVNKIIQPMEGGIVRITDFKDNPKGIIKFFNTPWAKK